MKCRLLHSFLLLCILLPASPVVSQEIEYEDLYAKLPSLTPSQAYTQFFTFQQQNPFFPNTYIQLGHICELKLREVDPFRDFQQAQYWASNALLFYNLFPVYLKDGDVRRNREYYANLITPASGKKIEQEDVLSLHSKRVAFCQAYKDTVALAYKILAKSKEHYNNSIRIFNEISNSYSNLKIALLRTNSTFLKLLDSLNIQYVASLDSFKAYQDIIAKFPIAKYNQRAVPKTIETFRLDGITNSDFLDSVFTVWNYGQWVKEYNDTYRDEILPLRRQIIDIQELFKTNRQQMNSVDTIPQTEKFTLFDDLFLYRLGKYDSNSLIRDLFCYLRDYQALLVSSKSSLNIPADSSSALLNRKMRYYYRLTLEHTKASQTLELLKNSIDTDKVLNHKDFFAKYYHGAFALADFPNVEGRAMKKLMDENFEKLRQYLLNVQMRKMSLGYSTGKQRIPQVPNYSIVGDVTNEPYIAYSVSYFQEKPSVVGGFMNRPNKKPSAFIAKIDENSNTEWVREIGNSPDLEQGDCARFVCGCANGCLAVVSGCVGDSLNNSLIRVDNKGAIVFKKQLEDVASPCFFQFDEITQNSLLGFGVPTAKALSILNPISLNLVDSVGTSMWKSLLPVTGMLVDIIRSGDKYLAFINYQNYYDGLNHVAAGEKPEQWGHLIAIIDSNSGSVEAFIPLKSVDSYSVSAVFSISSTEICLVGQTIPLGLGVEGLVRYFLVSNKGQVLYSNF